VKFKFSINTDHAMEHKAIIVLAGVFAFINVLSALKSGGDKIEVRDKLPIITSSVDAVSGTVTQRVTKWQNPSMPFWKRYLCRGFQRSDFCSTAALAPEGPDFEDPLDPQSVTARQDDRVIYYRGSMPKNSALTSRLAVPEAEVPPVKLRDVGQPPSH
jgi:hypothetical protein